MGEISKIITRLKENIRTFFLGETKKYPQHFCLEKWYSKESTVFTQDFIRESILRYGSERQIAGLVGTTSYYDIKRILFNSNLYKDQFELTHNKWRNKFINTMLKYKYTDIKRQSIIVVLVNILFVGSPQNYLSFKIYSLISKIWK